MPVNQNQNKNSNSYNYNPNRPQAGANPPTESQSKNVDPKKVVATVTKKATEYFVPGIGGIAYETVKKVPGIGGAVDNTTDATDQIPGVKKVSKGLNDSGVTVTTGEAPHLIGSKKAGIDKSAGNMNATLKKASIDGDATPVMPIRKNNDFNSRVRNNEAEDFVSSNNESPQDSDSLSNSEFPTDNIENDDKEGANSDTSTQNSSNPNNNKRNVNKAKGNMGGNLLKKIWKRYKIPILLGVGGIVFFFLILVIIFGGVSRETQTMGYVDTACNFNETKVTVTNCYQSSSEKDSLAIYNLDDFIIHLAYAYTNGGNYSDDAILALMVALKTNTLSYGNYNSSSKEIDVRICDVFSGYEGTSEDSSDKLVMLDASEDELNNLESLYEEISNYLYISSSYRSTISNLSSQNILNFDNNTLNEFEAMAGEGNTYSQILNNFYNSSSDDSDTEDNVYRETLFLGDSRTRGMQNAGVINSGNTIYGIGYGYDWLVGSGEFSNSDTNATNGGINGINDLMRDTASYNIVIWLGVNDLGNAEAYFEEYQNLATGDWSHHQIYIVSVGPVDDDLSTRANNDVIQNFNNTMSSLISSSGLSNLIYLDLGYTEDSIESYDSAGIHYSSQDYVNIYNIIINSLDNSLNSNYQLYNLTSYCTYYTLSENDAYWWPIGSNEATEGNIYGGDPASINITSYFGPRNDPIEGYIKGHGAIDIGVSEGTAVIATKSGEINLTNTGCSVGDHDCGGGYGNYIKIDHGDGIESLYAHLSEVLVSEGESVTQGEIIGYSGNTGRSTGPHLHFEIRLNGTRVDPLEYVNSENPRPINADNINFSLSGNSEDNKNMVCSSLLSSGLSKNAVAGIMVNMQAESGFNPINLQNSYENSLGFTDSSYTLAVDNGTYNNFVNDSAGYGLVQWTYYSRKQNLYDFAQSKNVSIGDMGMQLEFFLQELSGYSTTYKYVTGNYEAYDISYHFCTDYERPEDTVTACTSRVQDNLDSMLIYVQNGCSN